MATYSKYKLYELYETNDGINWFPTGEYKAILSEMYSEDCGYSARTIVEYDYECSGTTKIITATTKNQETYDSGATWTTISSTSSVTYEENSVDCGFEPKDYFTMVARTSGTFVFKGKSTNTIQYSTDYGNTWSSPSNNVTVNVNSGDNIMWKGEMTSSTNGIGNFSGTATFDIQGDIMSLLFGDNFENQTSLNSKNYAFYMLFYNSNVINAQNLILPATTLANNCYEYMFSGCTSLTTAPVLSATTLMPYCYSNMFNGCTSLTTAPQLLATTLAQYCCKGMFQGCTSLTTAPQLLATTLVKDCYNGMFQGCTSLTTAPVLSATTLVENCYSQMFYGCSNLNYIKMLATDISGFNCLFYWVYGVASSGTFVKSANAPSDLTSYIPNNWTVQNA